MEDLKNYKVVGCSHNNVLVAVDTTSHNGPNCFAIKVLRKSSSILDPEKPSIIPSTIPFMVKLLKWFNSEDTIVLVLQYAAGGRLIDFVRSYQTKNIAASLMQDDPASSPNILCSCGTESACKLHVSECSAKQSVLPFTQNSSSVDEDNCSSRGFGQGQTQNFAVDPANDEIAPETLVRKESHAIKEDDKNGLSYTDKCGVSSTQSHLYNFGTETLIENSLALLKVVSKTLDDQKKSSNANLDLPDGFMHSDSELPPLKNDANPDLPIRDGISMNSKILSFGKQDEDDQAILSDTPLRVIPERCLKIWAAEIVIALDKLHSQGITYG